jgi:organic radical activating enzyme
MPVSDFDTFIDQYNVSPKLANSNNSVQLREKESVFKYFSICEKASFKFVIDTPKDLDEVAELISKYNINPFDIYLMPQGTTGKDLDQKQQWLVEICKKLGYNYTDRLHIHIYGDKRGV